MIGKVDAVAVFFPYADGIWMLGCFAVSKNVVDLVGKGFCILLAKPLAELMKCGIDFFCCVHYLQLCVRLARANHITIRASIKIAKQKHR